MEEIKEIISNQSNEELAFELKDTGDVYARSKIYSSFVLNARLIKPHLLNLALAAFQAGVCHQKINQRIESLHR